MRRRFRWITVEKTIVFTCDCGYRFFFKSVNDSYGHEKGDEVLKYVAGALRKAVGEDGFSARWAAKNF